MSQHSRIEWTEASWNPIRGTKGKWHCVKVSPGCANCYAETFSARFGGQPYRKGADTLRLDAQALTEPLRWKKPRRIFVCSMTDLFAEEVPFEWIDKIFAIMALCPRHTFQVLTKRAERMAEYINAKACRSRIVRATELFCAEPHTADFCDEHIRRAGGVLPNVWLGVSVEDQPRADERIPHLLRCPAAVRWISCEPLLGLVDLSVKCPPEFQPWLRSDRIGWVVCGGESGRGARPMHPDWARSLRDQCAAAGVPFFFKQWGEWGIYAIANDYKETTNESLKAGNIAFSDLLLDANGKTVPTDTDWLYEDYPLTAMRRVGRKAAGRVLDGKTHDAYPEARA